MPEDAILHFNVTHKNATSPGAITQSSEDGKTRQPARTVAIWVGVWLPACI